MNQVQPRMNKARQDRIVAAAREIAAQEGWEAVTVRRIAAGIGCSAPAIYQYFRDKDAVLAALADEAEALLHGRMQGAVNDVGGPAKRLRALAKVQWDFAFERPELYQLLAGGPGVRCASTTPLGKQVAAVWHHAASAWTEKKDAQVAAADLADQLVALVHGFIALAMGDGLSGDKERAYRLMSDAVEALLHGVEKK